jgi:hypothetical protein
MLFQNFVNFSFFPYFYFPNFDFFLQYLQEILKFFLNFQAFVPLKFRNFKKQLFCIFAKINKKSIGKNLLNSKL